ncbi:Deacetylase [subsurface metagenome]
MPLAVKTDYIMGQTGVTTFVDAGSAGAGNFCGFKEFVIDKAKARIYAFLNICYSGLVTSSNWIPEYNRQPIHFLSVPAALEVGRKYNDVIVGIKVMCSSDYNFHGLASLELAKEAAKILKKPVMVHRSSPPPTSREILPKMEFGDILTHSFRGEPNTLLNSKGLIIPELHKAKENGVVIDIGHGSGSFSVEVAKKMLAQKFFPDIISSDLHISSIKGPAYDLPTTMSKFLSLGMNLKDVIAAVTCTPAKVIGKNIQLGHLKKGTLADIAIFELKKGKFQYKDCSWVGDNVIESKNFWGDFKLEHKMTILSGEILEKL